MGEKDSNTVQGYQPATSIEGGYTHTFSVGVSVHLYEKGFGGRLIEGDAPDVLAARYGLAAMKCGQFLSGLSVLVSLATITTENNLDSDLKGSVNDALHIIGELGHELSEHAIMCASELLALYDKKGGGR
jgi:hypothetical protein